MIMIQEFQVKLGFKIQYFIFQVKLSFIISCLYMTRIRRRHPGRRHATVLCQWPAWDYCASDRRGGVTTQANLKPPGWIAGPVTRSLATGILGPGLWLGRDNHDLRQTPSSTSSNASGAAGGHFICCGMCRSESVNWSNFSNSQWKCANLLF